MALSASWLAYSITEKTKALPLSCGSRTQKLIWSLCLHPSRHTWDPNWPCSSQKPPAGSPFHTQPCSQHALGFPQATVFPACTRVPTSRQRDLPRSPPHVPSMHSGSQKPFPVTSPGVKATSGVRCLYPRGMGACSHLRLAHRTTPSREHLKQF